MAELGPETIDSLEAEGSVLLRRVTLLPETTVAITIKILIIV